MSSGGRRTVLYVGSRPQTARNVASAVESAGLDADVRPTESMAAALERVAESDVDCVVSEHELADGDSLELLDRVQELDSSLPFVVFADGSESLSVEAFRAGVTDYVPRTDDAVDELVARLGTILEEGTDGRSASAVGTTESAATLSALLEHLPAGVIVEDDSREILAANRALTTLFGMDVGPSSVVGRDCAAAARAVADQFVRPDEFVDGIERTLEAREPVSGQTLDCADGRTLERDYVPFDVGQREANLWLYRDVTEQAEREQLLLEREAELEAENERLDAFARTLSHDVRGPLAVATGRLELARDEFESDHLDAVADALDRLEALIEDVLTLAREGRRVETTESVSVGTCARNAWEHVQTADATLEVDSEWTTDADPSRLERLFENLFRNAVEHGDPSVHVRVGALPNDDGFYVEDDGVGIPRDERDEIFEEGYSTGEDGSGFGLAIVERIAWSHGWVVDVTDAVDGGARFEFRDAAAGLDADGSR